MGVEFAFQCSGVLQTDLRQKFKQIESSFMRTPWDACIDSNMVRADFGSGLICPRTQTCMDSKVIRAGFGSGLICPRAQTCCASLTRTPARLANSPGFKSFRYLRWRIKFSLERFSDSVTHPFACPAVGKFSRASSAGPPTFARSTA